jgi:hypothetical protein
MADSAPKVAARERREALAAVNEKAEALANQIRKSTHLIVFTGAGVSTSAGEFRRSLVGKKKKKKENRTKTRYRNPRLSRPQWKLDTESPRQTAHKGCQHTTSYTHGIAHGACGIAESGDSEVSRQSEL